MLMVLKQNILLCLLSIVSMTSYAQEAETENLLWSNLHITKELPQKKLSTKVKVSYYSTIPLFSPRFIDVGMNYNPTNRLSFGLYYRFKSVFNTNSKRFYLETSYRNLKIETLDIAISGRFRIQHRTNNDLLHTYQMRPRLMIKKPLTDNSKLYTSVESFYSNDGRRTSFHFDRFRMDLGVSYKVPHTKHQLKIYYRYQADEEDNGKSYLSMLNISYRFNF